jgi:hypothetical protein
VERTVIDKLASMIARDGSAHADQAGRGARGDLHQARPEPDPARHARRAPPGSTPPVTANAKLDGKYLLRTSDPHLSTEDIALGYKQLLEVERG